MELLGEILPFDVHSILKPIAKANVVLDAFPPDCYWGFFFMSSVQGHEKYEVCRGSRLFMVIKVTPVWEAWWKEQL